MPLARRRIGSSFEYGHPDLYQNSQADTMLQDVTMASSTGTLAQIGLLSHYATELFQDLFTTAQGLQERLDSASSRVRALNAQLPRVCDVVARCDGDSVHRSGTLPEREHPQRVQFTVETMPRGLRERYDALEPPPDFSRIDALLPPEVLEKEGPSSQKFSHPGLFLDQWAQEELRKMEELKKRRQEEREERRRRRKALPKRERKPVPKVEAPPLIAEDQAPPVESAPVTPATREERPTIEIPDTPLQRQLFLIERMLQIFCGHALQDAGVPQVTIHELGRVTLHAADLDVDFRQPILRLLDGLALLDRVSFLFRFLQTLLAPSCS